MDQPRCPGQDMRNWTAEDVYDVICPHCQKDLEFCKDEPMRLCPHCGGEVPNPKIDMGCAEWCTFADDCLNSRLRPTADGNKPE